MFVFAGLFERVGSSIQRTDCSKRRNIGAFLCTLAVTLTIVLFALFASGQNIINTAAGGGPVNGNPALADVPGPAAAVKDANGNIYVAVPMAQQIFELSASGTLTVFAGAGYYSYDEPGVPPNGPALSTPLGNPAGVAVDTLGNVYIADTGNGVVRMVDTTGYMKTVAGNHKPCGQGACGDGGAATSARLNAPQGVAVDSSGNIYIADTGDNRVRCVLGVVGGCGDSKHKYSVGTIVRYAGTLTVCPKPTNACGDGFPAGAANLNSPMGIALDGKGNLYIADTFDNRIRVVNTKHIINTIAGTGNLCSPPTGTCGDGGQATQAYLSRPYAISVDNSGNVYIADTLDNRIRIVSAGTINTFAGTGVFGFNGDGGSPAKAQLAAPNGVLVDGLGNVFICDTANQRLRQVTPGASGVISTILGGGNGGDNGAATAARLASPYQVAINSSNDYYIADSANNRIRFVRGGNIFTVAGNGNVGYSGDGGPAASATLHSPLGVAVDASGNIYIADTYNRVLRTVNAGTQVITTFAGTGRPCSPSTGLCGDGGPAVNANLSSPSTVAVDKLGEVFIADNGAARVRKVDTSGTIWTVAGTGQPGYAGDGGPATLAQLNGPFGIVLDTSGNLYIADARNNVVRCVVGASGGCGGSTLPVGTIITYAYNGNINFQGDGGPAIHASRWNANQVAVDSRGNLFIGGGQDNLVQRVDLATGIIVTVAGNDKYLSFGFAGDGGPATTKALLDNVGLGIDSNETLLIADAGNNRIREVPLVPVVRLYPALLNFGTQPVGRQSQPMTVTLTNTGADDLSIASIVASGDFAQTNNCPGNPGVLAPSLSCTITVTFTPTQKGQRNGRIMVTDNGFKSPQSVKLTGTGE